MEVFSLSINVIIGGWFIFVDSFIIFCITFKGLSYYKKCWECCSNFAKVVQGYIHDVMGAVAKIAFQTQQISDKNNTLFNLL